MTSVIHPPKETSDQRLDLRSGRPAPPSLRPPSRCPTGIQIVGAPHGTAPALLSWVLEVADSRQPDRVVFTDGSDEEWTRLTDALVAAGTFTRLTAKPNSFYAASDPTDVARVEDRTYICSVDPADAGATNNWMDPCVHEGDPHGPVPRVDARPDDVRRAVLHGPVRRTDAPSWAWRSPTPNTLSPRCG